MEGQLKSNPAMMIGGWIISPVTETQTIHHLQDQCDTMDISGNWTVKYIRGSFLNHRTEI